MGLRFVLFSVLLVAIDAGPIQLSANKDSKTCSRSCTGSSKFNYVQGRTYNYKYESDIKTSIQGASEDMASLHLSANVQMEVFSKCEISMRLSDVTLTEYDPEDSKMKEASADFKAGLEKFPTRFSYQDGGIEEICLSADEPTWVLNAKRGIISLFQNKMDNFARNHTVSETDVSGVCDTKYSARKSGYYTTSVSKSKNLLGCTDRHGYNTAIQGVPYTAQSGIQSLPLLKSDHNCVHEIDKKSGILRSVECKEQHMFRPFSKSDSRAITINTQTLTYRDETTGTRSPAPIKARVTLKFDHVHDVEGDGKSRKDITRKLMEICERTRAGVRPETPQLFTDLVYMMKSADIDTLSDINKMLKSEKLCSDNLFRTRKFFLDALPMTGTSASLHMITDLIISNDITGPEADMWLTTLSFIKNPTKDMLKEVKPLINALAISEKAMLSVGTLVHNYCYYHGDCENDNMVKAIVSAFVNKMAKGCKVKDENAKMTLMALRGIGNAGFATNAIPQLSLCMKLKANPIEIRLSAIEAFRRMPCGSDRIALMNILQDIEEDSEIRIAAYKVLMECPSNKVLGIVRNTLAREEVNQVGSYIWTHLTNLMETSDRHKQDIRAVLEDETFKKEFDLDKRKFSRNYEGSAFIDRINTGAKIEGDLIWSSKSFIPRSGMMNLTFDLFGHSVNLFEIGGRAEGLEYFMESIFGPNGYFHNPKADTDTKDVVPKNIRADKLKKIDQRFSTQLDDLRGSLYMRVFGNELRYMNFKGLDSLLSGPSFNILDMLIKLSQDNDYTFTHSAMFMDSTYIVPTSSGFPLYLTVNGTATVDLRMKGKMDLRHPPTLNIAGRIQPSAAIDISSMMSVDAFVTKSGVKMVSTLHTNTALEGKISIDEKGSITSEYEMPEPRMEIIDVKSSFFTVHRDTEREQKMIEENRQTLSYCSSEKVVTVTGLELCAEFEYPNASNKADAPYFPLTGPLSAGIYLYNRDTHVKYILEAKSLHSKDKNIVHFKFDTPNSRIDRHVAVDFSLNKVDHSIDASLTSPWKKANILGTVINTKKASGLSGKISIDEHTQYSFDAKMTKDISGNAYIYKPSLELKAKNKILTMATGMVTLKKNLRQCDVEFNIDGTLTQPLSTQFSYNNKDALMGIQGSIGRTQNKQYSFNIHLATTTYKKKVLYKPLVSIRTPEAEVMALGGGVTYIMGKGLDMNLVLDKVVAKKITLKGKVNKAIKRRRSIFNTKLDFTSGPADFALKARFDKRAAGTLASDIDFTYVIRRVARNNLKLVSKITNQSSRSLTKAKANMNFEVKRNPELNMKVMSEISHNKKHTEIAGDIWYGPNFKDESKHIDLRFEMNRVFRSLMNVSADINTRVRVPALNFITMVKGAHSHDDKNLNSGIMFKFGKSQPMETILSIKDNTNKLMKVDAEYQLTIPGYSLDIEHVLEQTVDNRYISTLKSQVKKGQKSEIITTVIPDSRKVAFESDIQLYGRTPANFKGTFGLEPSDFITSLAFEKDSKKYAGSLTSATEMGKSSWLTLDISHPEQHVVFSLKGRKDNNVIFGDADLQLDTNKKISIKSWFESPTSEKLNGSLTVITPNRTVILNTHLMKGSSFISHVDFQWDPSNIFTADTAFNIKGKVITGNAKFTTPFKTLPKLEFETQVSHDSEQYNLDAKLALDKTHTILVKSEIKKPISIKTLVASFDIKSSKAIYGLKTLSSTINHKLSKSLASELRFGWNKQFIHTTIVLQNKTKGIRVAFDGTLDLKTSYLYMKKGKVSLSHDNNRRDFNTIVSFNRNKRSYKMVSKITHQPSPSRYDNTGIVKVSSPYGNMESEWNHRHTEENIASTFTSTWGKNNNKAITGRFTSNFDNAFDAKFELQTPFEFLQETSFETSLSRGNGLHCKLLISANRNQLGSAEIGYSLKEDKYSAGLKVKIPDLNVETKIEATANLPKNGEVSCSGDIVITPEISISIEGSQKISESGALAHTVLQWKSTFPGYEQIRYSYELLADEYLSSVITLLYQKDKEIKLETKFAFERTEKHLSVVLQTPFESLRKFEGQINVKGDLDAFKTDVFIVAQPLFAKTAVQFSWNTKSGLVSNIRIDLPFAEYPYFQADVNGQFSTATSEVQLKVEYMPREILVIEGSHSLIGSALSLNGKAVTPYGTIIIGHSGKPNDFTFKLSVENSNMGEYSIAVGFTNTNKISGTVNLSVPGRKDIIMLFTHSGSAKSFNTHAEVQHNRKNYFLSDLSFEANDKVKISFTGSLKTQVISETEEYQAAFDLNGVPSKFETHGEFETTSLGKSQADIKFDIKTAMKGNIVIKSQLMKNIKASFSHLSQHNDMESKFDIIHGGKKIIDLQVNLNKLDSLILEVKLVTPVLEDITFMSRYDGEFKNFVIRSEGKYGQSKADAELTSKIDMKMVHQKMSFSATGMQDISAEFNHIGDFLQFKSYVEFNNGTEKHRLDLDFSRKGTTEGSFSLASPYLSLYAANFQVSGNPNDFRSHAELTVAKDTSSADLTINIHSITDAAVDLKFRSPFLKDISLSFKNEEKAEQLSSTARLSIEDKEDFDLKLTSAKQPLSIIFALKSPIGKMASFQTSLSLKNAESNGKEFHFDYTLNGKTSEVDATYSQRKGHAGQLLIKSHLIPDSSVSFELEGELKNFKGHADYNFGQKKSEIDIFYNGISRKEGLMTIKSHFSPDLSVGFEHDGTIKNFKSHGEYMTGFDKREFDISVNVQNDIEINMQYVCPIHGISRATFTHKGKLSDFNCHAEISGRQHELEADFSFSLIDKIYGLLKYRPSYSSQFDPLTMSFVISGTATNFQSNSEFILGNERTAHELRLKVTNSLISTNLNITSPYMRDLSANFRLEGGYTNIKMQSGFMYGSDVIDTVFTYEVKSSVATSTFSLSSSMCSDISSNFIIQGELKDFSTNVSLEINNHEHAGSINFKQGNTDIDSVIELKSKYIDDTRLELHHSGNIKKFTTNYITTIAGKKNKASVKFNLMDRQGKISLDEPKLLFEGSFGKNAMTASLKNGTDEYSLSFSYSLKKAVIINCRVTTPFDGYKSILASYEHTGNLRNFKCTGKLEIEGKESVFNLKLNTEKMASLDCSLDMSSPYILPIDMKISNAVKEGKYLSTIDLQRNNKKALGLSISAINETENKELYISLTINDVKHKIVEISLSSSGFTMSSSSFSNNVDITFSKNPKLVATIALNNRQFPMTYASIDFDGTPHNFVSSFDLNVEGKSSNHFTASLNTVDKIAGTFTLDLPLLDLKEMSGDFHLASQDSGYKLEAKMTNELMKLFSVKVNLNTNNFDLELESNRPHQLSARLSFTIINQNIKVSWDLTHARKNLINGNVDLTMNFNPVLISGSAAMNTQILGTTATIHIDQSVKSFKAEGSIKRNKDTWSVLSRLDANNNIDAEFSITAPNMEDIRGTLVHTKHTYKSKTNVELRLNATHHISYDMDLKWRNGLDGVFSLKTPYKGYENMKLKTEHEGSFPNMKSSAEITIAENVIATSATFSQRDSYKAEFMLSTPYEQLENLALSMYHDGELSSFRTGGKLMYATGEDIELDVDHMWIGMTQLSKVRFMSPFTNEIAVSANHSGTVADFSSAYEMTMGTDLKIVSKTTLKTGEQFLLFLNEMTSSISGETHENKIELRHDGNIEKFKTEALLQSNGYFYRVETSFQLDPIIEGSVELITPFKNFKDLKASFSHTGSVNSILTTGEVQFAPLKRIGGKIDIMQYSMKKTKANIELMTPFEKMKLNKLSYEHSVDSNSIYCQIDSSIYEKDITGTLKASKSPLSANLDIKTPFEGFETLCLNGQFEYKRKSQSHGRLSAKWNPTSQIVAECKVSSKNGEISITTPFPQVRDASIEISERKLANGLLQSIKIIHNDKSLIDFDVDHSLLEEQKHILINTRAPRSMKFEIDGEFSPYFTDFDMEANWNTADLNSRLSTEVLYDIRSQKSLNIKLTQSELPGKILALSAFVNGKHSKADLSWGLKPEDKYGYEINIGDYDCTLKLVLPSQSLKFSGLHRGQVTEGTLMWDADRDEMKAVSIKSSTVTASEISKASILIMMPSLGKNVQVGSEISINQGRVIFDGKTELLYSGDSSKKLVFTSKLEDISAPGSQNYSLSFGVSHPYTTLGVTVNTNAGRSQNVYTAGIGLEYLTVKRETKKFHMGARIDKLMKAISFELQSPVKSISISGKAQSDEAFQLSLLNIYDQRQPLSTTFTFNPTARSVDFVTNFDEDQPRNEFHINLKYVNSTAISGEVYHILRHDRVADIVVTAQLNTSHILHNRIHWRPEMLKDLEAFIDRKLDNYHMRLRNAATRIEPEIVVEVTEKFRKIWSAVEEEIGVENIAAFEAAVVPYLDLVLQHTVAMSEPLVQPFHQMLLTKSRNDNMRQLPIVTTDISTEEWDYERLFALKQTISDKFNFVSDKMKLPAKYIPKFVNNVMSNALNYTSERMPTAVASQILVLKSYGLIDAIEEFIKDEIIAIEKEAETKLRELEEIIMGHMKSPITVYDPAHGEIQMELYSFIPIQSLDSLPSLKAIRFIEKLRDLKNSLANSIPDVTLPDWSGEWVPPFTGVASVSLGHKITTFDGYVYDLNNGCTYILSRDYLDGNFTLVLSNDGYTTLTVLSPGKPVSINLQGEILLDGKPAKLPFTEGYITVTKSDIDVVTIKGGNHFSVDYDLSVDHMRIEVSGWYHGRTGGLLGVYDNEPSNDKMTSFNKVVENNARFAKTWEVGTASC